MTDEEEDFEEEDEQPQRGLSGFKKAGLGLIVLLLVGSLLTRAIAGGSDDPATAGGGVAPPPGAHGLVGGAGTPGAGSGAAKAEEPGSLESMMPLFTEASFFALIGFALGYASRKVVKIGLILLALLFVAIQAMSYADVVQVDWGRAIDLLNTWILNIKEDSTVTEILKDRVPSTGGFVTGYLIGFRRG